MAMTKKHFKEFAAIIAEHECSGDSNADKAQRDTAASIARAFARMCKHDNLNFDYARFYSACSLDASGRAKS